MTSAEVIDAGWGVLGAALVACALLPLVTSGRFATLFDLNRRLTRSRLTLVAVFLGWLWVGWHFFAR